MMFSVNGGWGSWASWSTCGVNCQKTRSRRCNNPAPVNGGQNCVGDQTTIIACSGGNCSNKGKGEIFYCYNSRSKTFVEQLKEDQIHGHGQILFYFLAHMKNILFIR